MSPSQRPRPSVARSASPVLLAGALATALAGCGASMDAQTYQERTQAGATNTAIGTLAVRGLYVVPPEEDRLYEAGEDATAVITVTNSDDEDDTLLEASTPAAEEVEILVDGEAGELDVPALGTTGDAGELRLVGLTDELREGEYITMTLRFENNGTLEVPVPIGTSGETDRPVYTGEEGGEEGEPALQAPAGGHGIGEDHGDEGGDEAGENVDSPGGEVPGGEGSVEDDEVDQEGGVDELGDDPVGEESSEIPTESDGGDQATADETQGERGVDG